MEKTLLPYQHLKIQLEEITSATNNFHSSNYIGAGGFGPVYKGEVSHSKGRSMVAIKRLDRKVGGQGLPEFLKEITMLSDYKHGNIISLLGLCCEGREMILIYELASRGSLERHLNSPHLTWTQRLKICLDAAKGLSYLHDPREIHQRLIHCDIKSANILLDDQWNAKVSDFGLSIMGSANEEHSVIVTMAAGTRGYIDPEYEMTNTLTKESDIYSFGVVLFEVLCGRLCCIYKNNRIEKCFVPTWTGSYRQKKLDDVIFKSPTIQQLEQSALETFSDIAYRCVKESREDRPTMAEVVTELEGAFETRELFESQVFNEWKAQLLYYEEITKTSDPLLNYRSEVKIINLLFKGVLLNSGKTYFSLNKKGEHCEMISLAECLDVPASELEYHPWSKNYNSRFSMGVFQSRYGIFETCLKAQFLSPGVTYTVNLLFKFGMLEEDQEVRKCEFIELLCNLPGETENNTAYLAYEREDGWWVCELYQFTSEHCTFDLEIMFDGFTKSDSYFIAAEGIEFRPLERDDEKLDMRPVSNLDLNWEEIRPIDYEDIIELANDSLRRRSKKEAYAAIRKGFLTGDKKWFYLDKNEKKCHMISASTEVLHIHDMEELSLPESRFEKNMVGFWKIRIVYYMESYLVSPQTTYATYLVYKLPEDQSQSELEGPTNVTDISEESSSHNGWYIYLANPQTPVIRSKAEQHTCNQANRPKLKGLPQQRNDGWMEVQIWEFQTNATNETIVMNLELARHGPNCFSEIIIEGIEFRPI